MAREIYQVRYYPNDPNLSNITDIQELASGRCFVYPIVQLGIEANENTLFYLNNSLTTVSVGASEVFQLDDTRIMSLKFVRASLEQIKINGGHIIVDYICESGQK